MLVCSTPVYKKVIEEYKHPHTQQDKSEIAARRSQQQPRSRSTSPIKTKKDDFYSYLAGQPSVYGSPDWHNKWGDESLLPTLQDDHKSHVLLPSIRDQGSSDPKKKERSTSVNLAQTASALSSSAQRLLQNDRERSHRPHSAKTRNEQALRVKEKHAVTRAQPLHDRPRSSKVPLASKKDEGRGVEEPRERKRGGKEQQRDRRASQLNSKRASSVAETASSSSSIVILAMQEEMEAMKRSEAAAKQKLKEKDETIQQLRASLRMMEEELEGAREREKKIDNEIEEARHSNLKFHDVSQLLQLSESERVSLIERNEMLMEENSTWRPMKTSLEGKLAQLMEQLHDRTKELERLKDVEKEMRAEKEKNAACLLQIESWQEIAKDLQSKCDRWEALRDKLEETVDEAQEQLQTVQREKERLEQRLQTYERRMLEHDIALDDEGEVSGQEQEEQEEEQERTSPRTSTRTMNILVGKTSEDSAPPLDTQPSAEAREEEGGGWGERTEETHDEEDHSNGQ